MNANNFTDMPLDTCSDIPIPNHLARYVKTLIILTDTYPNVPDHASGHSAEVQMLMVIQTNLDVRTHITCLDIFLEVHTSI